MDSIARSQKIGIYIGKGASYSWIWFVKTFDALGFHNVYFIDENDVCEGVLRHFDCFILPGGDPFQVAEGLETDGLAAIRRFVEEGGTYIGVCAGTYLSIIFHDDPLPWLNFEKVPVNNFSLDPPEAIRMRYKYLVSYQDGYVYHPVRGPLRVTDGTTSFSAPLYGGPPMIAPREYIMLEYEGFEDKTLYLIEEDKAFETMVGYAAGIHIPVGAGQLYLFGPHCEHPQYPRANNYLNDVLVRITPQAEGPGRTATDILRGEKKKRFLKSVKRELSSARIIASGMTDLRWKIGEKIWEDEKITYFLTETWKTIKQLQKHDCLPVEGPSTLISMARRIHVLLSDIRTLSKEGRDTNTEAAELIDLTKLLSKGLFDCYFNYKRRSWMPDGKDCGRDYSGGKCLCMHTVR
ncbi:hypothetical protein EF808_01685 [archaeon]|nr:MAG: hypothetical protein EF808_01685 [archaeon]